MPTITLPDAWALVAPCGCVDGLCSTVIEGRVIHGDEASAWKLFTPLKKDRDRETKQGYKIEPVFGRPAIGADCPHDPKWGIA